jgi:hypothetical protein
MFPCGGAKVGALPSLGDRRRWSLWSPMTGPLVAITAAQSSPLLAIDKPMNLSASLTTACPIDGKVKCGPLLHYHLRLSASSTQLKSQVLAKRGGQCGCGCEKEEFN